MSETRYDEFIRSSEESVEYWTETAITDFTEELCRRMEELSVSRAELARRIGHSQAYVTKALRGNVNFTLATMTKFARALDTVVRVHLAPVGVVVEWNDRPAQQETFIQYLERYPSQQEFEGIIFRTTSESAVSPDPQFSTMDRVA